MATSSGREKPARSLALLAAASTGERPPTIEEYARQIAESAPPLTEDQRNRLTLIFQSAKGIQSKAA